MELLQDPSDRGYPTEYLLSRIKGRRSKLIRNWKSLLYDQDLFLAASSKQAGMRTSSSPVRIWADLVHEYRWVHGQMNRELRKIFHPYFLYAELRTIFICLRNIREKKEGVLDELLVNSLLSDEMKKVLLTSDGLAEAVAGIERMFIPLSEQFAGLSDVAQNEGLRGVEQRLTEAYLTVTVGSRLHPLVHLFFSRLIDARNIISLYKYLRLELKSLPPALPGGGIPEARLREAAGKGDLPAIGSLIHEFTGIKVERPEPTMVEVALYTSMTRWLHKEGREPFGVAPILDYLWRCSIEAMNLSVLYHTKDLEREMVAAELVQ